MSVVCNETEFAEIQLKVRIYSRAIRNSFYELCQVVHCLVIVSILSSKSCVQVGDFAMKAKRLAAGSSSQNGAVSSP